jgi:hypothetical protein
LLSLNEYQTVVLAPSRRDEVQVDFHRLCGTVRGRYARGNPKAEMAKGPNPLAPNHESRFGRIGGDLASIAAPVQTSSIFTMCTYWTFVGVRKRPLEPVLPPET